MLYANDGEEFNADIEVIEGAQAANSFNLLNFLWLRKV